MPKILTFPAIILVIAALLNWGQSVFVPLSFSLLIACILYPICKWMESKGVNTVAAIALSLSLLVVLGSAIVALLIWQIIGFTSEWGQLQIKIAEAWISLSAWLNSYLHISVQSQQDWINGMQSNYSNEFLPLLKTTIGGVSVMVVMLVLIPILSGLMLYERKRLVRVLHVLTPTISLQELRIILNETITTYYQFIKGMLVVYGCVAILNSVGLLLLGIPHAILFGCIAAVLTFIPYVGIMIGASLPIVVSWITYDSIYYPIGVIAIFAFVQYLEANVIFPWAVSSKLNVNTLMTIVAILVGGVIWGSSGMILFIPFMGILKLIADRMPGWESIAILLGASENKQKEKINPSA
jgi:predicted PurR-regulated permease PerM